MVSLAQRTFIRMVHTVPEFKTVSIYITLKTKRDILPVIPLLSLLLLFVLVFLVYFWLKGFFSGEHLSVYYVSTYTISIYRTHERSMAVVPPFSPWSLSFQVPDPFFRRFMYILIYLSHPFSLFALPSIRTAKTTGII